MDSEQPGVKKTRRNAKFSFGYTGYLTLIIPSKEKLVLPLPPKVGRLTIDFLCFELLVK